MSDLVNKVINKLVIIGAGGLGCEVAWLVERINGVRLTWDYLGFLDDNIALVSKRLNNYTVLGTTEWLKNHNDVYVVCAVGNSQVRKEIIERVCKYGNIKFATLVDPSVIMSNTSSIGYDSIICANTSITVNVNISNHVIVNPNCTIGHDSIIGEFVTLYPCAGIAGNCIIEDEVELGTGMKVIQGIKIGEKTIIGAGAVVINDIPSNCTAVGIPAKPIEKGFRDSN